MEKRTEEGLIKKRLYIDKYNNENTIVKTVRLNKIHDSDIINKLSSVGGFAAYIKRLIREDIKRG